MKALELRIASLVSLAGPLVTLVVTPWFNYDPINPPKVLVLSALAFSLFGLILGSKKLQIRIPRFYWLLFASFSISLWVPFLLATAPKSQQLWGIFGRDTGLLTYTSLSLILLASIFVGVINQIEKVLKYFIVTVIFVTAYALLQAVKLDPIKWSQQDTFATLGNVNFLAAFLGIGVVIIFAMIVGGPVKSASKVFFLVLMIAAIILIWNTDSIQGIVIAIFGMAIIIFTHVRTSKIWKIARYPTLFIFLVIAYFSSLGLARKGPLAEFLYQDSTVFRADYMRAALKMFQFHPLTGVGLDSYDGWYRRVRGFISAYRTGPSRTTNSSHNVILDLASGGGLVVLLSYLLIILVVFRAGALTLRKSSKPNIWEIAMVSAWFAYQIQSLVSINQIGVGIWGWILSGLIIGNWLRRKTVEITDNNLVNLKVNRKKQVRADLLPPLSAVLSIVLGLLGISLAFQPFKTDIQFRSAVESGNLASLLNVSTQPSATAFHVAKILEIAYKNQRPEEAAILADRLTKRYPDEPFGWQIQASLDTTSEQLRAESVKKLKEIDPWFACTDYNSKERIRSWYMTLSPQQRWELLQWWQIANGPLRSPLELSQLEASDNFDKRLAGYCGG